MYWNNNQILEIIEDFIIALDESIATYDVLTKLSKDAKKPNQLLFSHIVNSFDSFITWLLETIILQDPDSLTNYFVKNKNQEEKVNIKDILLIDKHWLIDWMRDCISKNLKDELSRKRHSQKLELLFETINLSKAFYINLFWSWEAWCWLEKSKKTPKKSYTINHKTQTEDWIWFADLLYEKRNAVTHNRGRYQTNTIIRLNSTWDLKIENPSITIKRATVNTAIRYYTTICIKLLNNQIIKNLIKDNWSIETSIKNLSDLQIMKQISTIKKDPSTDKRYSWGWITERKKWYLLNKEKFDMKKYCEKFWISDTTWRRDLKEFIK